MRILRVANVPDNKTGGMSRAMYGSGDALVARGHQVDYLWSEQLPPAGGRLLRRFKIPLALPRILRRLQAQGRHYDVIEIHEPLAAPTILLRRLRKLPPIVIFSHGLEERGLAAESDYKRQKGLKFSLKTRVFSLITIWQAMYAVRHANHVLCCNGSDMRYLIDAGVPPSRLTQHHNGMEPLFLKAGQLLENTNDKNSPTRAGVLFVGSWLERKGILDIVPAMNAILRRHPALRFTIAGCSAAESLVREAFTDDVQSQIEVISHIDSDQRLIELYSVHSIFVLPSVFEGFPLVMMEAAALGLALVTTNVCGMADFVENEVNGLTSSVGDTQALTDNMERLVEDDVLARRFGDEARRKSRLYTWDTSAEKIEEAYISAINSA